MLNLSVRLFYHGDHSFNFLPEISVFSITPISKSTHCNLIIPLSHSSPKFHRHQLRHHSAVPVPTRCTAPPARIRFTDPHSMPQPSPLIINCKCRMYVEQTFTPCHHRPSVAVLHASATVFSRSSNKQGDVPRHI